MNAQTIAPRLAWEYQDRASLPEYRATYRGFTIRAVLDQSPENPFKAWEGEPPTLVYSGGRHGSFTDYSGDTLADPLAAMTDGQISRHWRAIAKALDSTESDVENDARENLKGDRDNIRLGYMSGRASMSAARRAVFANALDDARSGNSSDYLKTLAALWRISGAVAVTWSSSGYSQSDWAEGLSVATPEWAAKVGAPRDSHKRQCEYAGKLWGYWAWGDVYGFTVDAGDDFDSCFGFYGPDFTESGLEEAARESVDAIVTARLKARQAKAAGVA